MAQVLWFTRSGGQVHGPFPAAQIEQWVTLGRLHAEDEISRDGQVWVSVEASEQFDAALDCLSTLHRDTDTPAEDWQRERMLARRRWLDERAAEIPQDTVEDEHRGGEPVALMALRHDHAETEMLTRQAMGRRPAYWIGLLAVAAMLFAATAVWYGQLQAPQSPSTQLQATRDCSAQPAPEIAWQGCDKRQAALAGARLRGAKLAKIRLDGADLRAADLSYADLRGAVLRGAALNGATLLGADLAGADLSGADLSAAVLDYASLNGADLQGIRFAGTRLGKTAYIDGRICGPESVDDCR